MRRARRAALAVTLAAALAVALAAAAATVAAAQAVTHGTLCANDGRDIYDWELELLIGCYAIDAESIIIAFTECYGGDKMDDFSAYDNVTCVSATSPGERSQYDTYDMGLAESLKPGTTTDAAHAHAESVAAANGATATPTTSGDNVTVGGTSSTHVLFWAGDPSEEDYDYAADVRDNFPSGANQTVTVLAGDGSDPGADCAATLTDLVCELDELSDEINPSEQLILFISDHGDLDDGLHNVDCGPRGCTVWLDMTAYDHVLACPDNEPRLSLFSETALSPAYIQSAQVNSHELGAQPPAIELDYDLDAVVDLHQYVYDVDESWLQRFDNEITLTLNDDKRVLFELVSLESGAIPPLPASTGIEDSQEMNWGVIKQLYR